MSAPSDSSPYGKVFDDLAVRWANLEREHDEVHPDRGECGGVGGCVMMRRAVELQQAMTVQMEDWRRIRPAR